MKSELNKIPIVISSDNNIFYTVGVVLTSLLENKNTNTFYEINCICAKNVTEENKNKLKLLEGKYSNWSLNFIDMNGEFEDLKTTKGYHVNYVSAYKMLIPSLFPQYDKVLYLDTDVIVRDDLTGFYKLNIGDNYLAGTPVLVNYIGCYEYLIKLLELENLDSYINAGVMLMNLKQIRKDNIDKTWIRMLGSFEGSVDQHILNKVCFNKTTNIPIKYNVCLSDIPFYKSKEVGIFYSLKEAKEALENPSIFHYAGLEKPWKYYDTFLAHEWYEYYKKSGFNVELKRTSCRLFKNFEYIKNTINNIYSSIQSKKLKYKFLGIPLLKIRTDDDKHKYYLFGFIKILTKNITK